MLRIPTEIKNLLKLDSVRKNFRVHFPNGERDDITNANIISESVTLQESLTDGDLKFGLCETPMISFETFGVDNVKGAVIECYDEIYCNSTVTGSVYRSDLDAYVYPIPYGRFVVDSCKKQADLTHRQFTCYNEIAYEDWQFPPLVKSALESILWKDKTLTISLEAIMGIILPGFGRTWTRTTGSGATGSASYSQTFTCDGVDYRLDFWDRSYGIFGSVTPEPAFSVVKEHYSPEYIRNVGIIKERLTELGYFANGLGFGEDDGYNRFTRQQVAINPSSSTWREYNITPGFEVSPLPQGSSKVFKPSNEAKVVPFFYMNTGSSSSYPYWQVANGGYFEGYGTMTTIVYSFFMPFWIRNVGMELVDVTHNEVIASAKTTADDDYIDHDMDSIKFLEGASGIKFTPKFSSKKITMASKNGTVKQTVYKATFNFLEQKWQDIFNAYAELQGKFGRVNRYGDIEFISLKDNLTALYPSETLYPSATLYPSGNVGIRVNGSYYETLWYDDDYSLPVGRITVVYNDSVEGNDYQVDVYCNGFDENSSPTRYRVYDLTENALIKSKTWTEADITTILNTIATNVTGVRYMPSEITMKGRPDLEVGDVLEIKTITDNILTYVLSRTITGIQNLKDDIKST